MPPRVPKRRQRGQAMVSDAQRRAELAATFADEQTLEQAVEYDAVRPRYPQQVVDRIVAAAWAASPDPVESAAALAHPAVPASPAPSTSPATPITPGRGLQILEWGAGTGILTREFLRNGAAVYAVEPSAVMLEVLERTSAEISGQLTVDCAPAEASRAPDQWADAVVAAQAWHWFDPKAVQAELRRVLRPGGVLCVVGNYLDTSTAWVHRLARIMRAGDVYRPEWQPDAGPDFVADPPYQLLWNRQITPEEILRLVTTLSSWLSGDESDRDRRRGNLQWYLYEHLGFTPGEPVHLPYRTVLHTARRR